MEAASSSGSDGLELHWVPPGALEALRAIEDPVRRVERFADACRVNVL